MVVVLRPHRNAVAGVLEAVELRPRKVFLKDSLPEPLDFPERLGMVRLGLDVLHLVLRKLCLELGLAPPVRVLAAVVGEHFLRHSVLSAGLPIDFKHMLGGLGGIQAKAYNISTVVIHKADQVHLLSSHAEAHDVRLPHLVGRSTLKKSGLRRIMLAPLFWRRG